MSGTALVTGVSGQDGGYLAEQLVAAGWSVHGLVHDTGDLPAPLAALGDAVVAHEGDLLDVDGVQGLVRRARPDVIYNLAGISSVARSWSDPTLTARVNGTGVAVLLEAAHRLQEDAGRPVRLLQASSAEIFAGTARVPQDESTPLAPRSPYGAAKAFGHHLVQVYRARGLHASNVVLYNHESPRRPPSFVTRKITIMAAAVATGRATQVRLGNLDARRDWGWAPDYVDAMVRAAQHEEPGDYVVATGTSHSVRDFALAALECAGVAGGGERVVSDPRFTRPTDATDLVGDATRARQVLGWAPTVPFEDVVARMVGHDLALAARGELPDVD